MGLTGFRPEGAFACGTFRSAGRYPALLILGLSARQSPEK